MFGCCSEGGGWGICDNSPAHSFGWLPATTSTTPRPPPSHSGRTLSNNSVRFSSHSPSPSLSFSRSFSISITNSECPAASHRSHTHEALFLALFPTLPLCRFSFPMYRSHSLTLSLSRAISRCHSPRDSPLLRQLVVGIKQRPRALGSRIKPPFG